MSAFAARHSALNEFFPVMRESLRISGSVCITFQEVSGEYTVNLKRLSVRQQSFCGTIAHAILPGTIFPN